jgi:hypothetical protein
MITSMVIMRISNVVEINHSAVKRVWVEIDEYRPRDIVIIVISLTEESM